MKQKFDKDLLSTCINLKMRELSEKHIKEKRKLDETIAGRGLSRLGSSIRTYEELYEEQFKEILNARLECILESLKDDLYVDEDAEEQLLNYLFPYVDNQIAGIKQLVKQDSARKNLPPQTRKARLDGISIMGNKLKDKYKNELRREIIKRNKTIQSQKKSRSIPIHKKLVSYAVLIIAILALIAAWLVVPEFRELTGLDLGSKPATSINDDTGIYSAMGLSLIGEWQSPAWSGQLSESWEVGEDNWLHQRAYYYEGSDTTYRAQSKIEQVGADLILFTLIENSNPKIFKATTINTDSVVFENSDYKNPNKVVYRFIDKDNFQRTIAGMENDSLISYTFRFRRIR